MRALSRKYFGTSFIISEINQLLLPVSLAILTKMASIKTIPKKIPESKNHGEVSNFSSSQYPAIIGTAKDAAISTPRLAYSKYFLFSGSLNKQPARYAFSFTTVDSA